jgi:UDP-2,3-diacylglucosamine hydrolase
VPRVNDPVIFISDAHLGAASREAESAREAALIGFLRWAGSRSKRLYIVGDLFDFWFKYRSVIPRRAVPVLSTLRELSSHGVAITWIGGNHDWWLGSSPGEIAGITVSREPLDLAEQGRRIHLAHGDGHSGAHDRGYRLLRTVIRARWSESLFRLLHPDVAFAFARRFSFLSRSVAESEIAVLDPGFAAFVRARLDQGFDAVITGHHHVPLHVRMPGGKDWVVLGDWFAHFTYGELAGGVLTLREWRDGKPGAVIAPVDRVPGRIAPGPR